MKKPCFPKIVRLCEANQLVIRQLAQIHEESPVEWNEDWVVDAKSIVQREKEIETKVSNEHTFFVLLNDQEDEIIGFHWIDFDPETKTGKIKSLWVHANYRGQGWAKRMKVEGEDWAKSLGARRMTSTVHWSNKRMLKINHAMGFSAGFLEMEKELV